MSLNPSRISTYLYIIIGVLCTLPIVQFSGCSSRSGGEISLDADDARYRIHVEKVYGGQRIFEDLRNDGTDEVIEVIQGSEGSMPAIIAQEAAGPVIDQVNFFRSKQIRYSFSRDINGDGDRDLFLVSDEDDTVFGCIVDVLHTTHSSLLRKIPLIVKPDSLEHLPAGVGADLVGLVDAGGQRGSLLICIFRSAFSLRPRGIAAFDLSTGTRRWYYPTGTQIAQIILADVNNDDVPEIFASTSAPNNGASANGTDDAHSYALVLSLDGKPLWEPRPTGGAFSSTFVYPVYFNQDRVWDLLCFNSSGNRFTQKSCIEMLNPLTGKPGGTRREFADELASSATRAPLIEKDGQTYIVVGLRSGAIVCCDKNLNVVTRMQMPAAIAGDLAVLDLDGDGRDDISIPLANQNTVVLDASFEPLAVEQGAVTFWPVNTLRGGERILAVRGDRQTLIGVLEKNPGALIRLGTRLGYIVLLLAGSSGLVYLVYRGYFYLQLFTTVSRSAVKFGIVVIGRNGKVLHTNAAMHSITGLKTESLHGKPWEECFGGEPLVPLRDMMEAMMATGRLSDAGSRVDMVFEGRTVNLTVRSYPVSAGKIRGAWLFLVADVTEALEGERMLYWASVAKNLAHEMKTPLSTIWFTLARIKQLSANEPSEPLGAHLASIEEEVRRVDNYVKEFMKLASVNPPNLQPVDLNGLIEEILSSYTKKLPGSIVIQRNFAQELPTIRLDVNLFTVVATNLFDNAVTAMRGKGTLRVSTYAARNLQDTSIVFSVSDTGTGISREDFPRIFQPYFTRSEGGTGLGLVITKKIVEDHGGKINFISREGLGTEFIVQLPAGESGGQHV